MDKTDTAPFKKEIFGKGISIVRNAKSTYTKKGKVSRNDNYSISIQKRVAKLMGLKNKQKLELMYYLEEKRPSITLYLPPISHTEFIQKKRENQRFLNKGKIKTDDKEILKREIHKYKEIIKNDEDILNRYKHRKKRKNYSEKENPYLDKAIKQLEGRIEKSIKNKKELKNKLNKIKKKVSS